VDARFDLLLLAALRQEISALRAEIHALRTEQTQQ
jgi:hypothetical protein